MKIQSYTDIITNSSSEIFMFKSDLPKDFLHDLIEEHIKSHMFDYNVENSYEKRKNMSAKEEMQYNFYSGTAGEWELFYADDFDEKGQKYYDFDENHNYMLDIDHNFNATIEWLRKEFKNVEMQ